MTKKIITSIFIVVLSVIALFACTPQNENNNNNNDNVQTANPSPVWGSGIETYLLINPDSTLDVQDIYDTIAWNAEMIPYIITDEIEAKEHEFIFGEADRDLYRNAYRTLENMINVNLNEHGWLAYAKDGSVAIAYSSTPAMKEAIEYIEAEWYGKSKLFFEENGVVASDVFLLSERADEARQEYRTEEFLRVEEELGKKTADALRKIYSFSTDDIYVWLANLFDPSICVCTGLSEDVTECQNTKYCGGAGFYHNNDGRDTVGYLPDIESTVQALNHLENGGMFDTVGKNAMNALSEEYVTAFLKFAKSLQSSEDGYFYHPQWGTNIIAARRGRDLGWAEQLISACGGKPYWNTPGGTTGELGAPGADAVQPTSKLTSRFSASVTKAVSFVTATASGESYLPAYLRSLDAWKTYIEELDILNDPYTAGNTLAAQHREINNAGETYINYLTNYLTENQNQETGFWGEGITYVTMDGFMKLSYSYSYYGRAIPNVEKAFYSTIQILLTPAIEGNDLHVCNTYNTWVNFNQIFYSLEKVTGGEEKIAELREVLRKQAPELINITYDKYLTHMQEDGSFSYHDIILSGASQGAPVGPALRIVGDVNATCIVFSTINLMFETLGIENINFYVEEDMDYFLELICNLDPVIKNSAPDVETQTFDRYDPEQVVKGVELYPSPIISNLVMDTTEENGVYKFFGASVVNDPNPSSSGDKAMKVNSYVYESGWSAVPHYSYSYVPIMNSVLMGNMYSFSFDFLVTETETKNFLEIGFVTEMKETTQPASAFTLYLSSYIASDGNQYIKIIDKYAGTDGIKAKLVDGIPLNKWNNLKVEVYVVKTTEEGTMRSNYERYGVITLNGEIVAISQAASTNSSGVVSSQTINACILAYARETDFEIYLDNIHAEEFIKDYVAPTVPEIAPPEGAITVDTAPAGTGIYFNDSDKSGTRLNFNGEQVYLPIVDSGPGDDYYIVNKDDPTDRYLVFYRTGASTSHTYMINETLQKTAAELEYTNPVTILEMDVLFANMPASASYVMNITMAEYLGAAGLYIGTNADGNIIFHNVAEDSQYVPLEQGNWYNLRFEYYPISYANKLARIQVYVDGVFAIELNGVDVRYYPDYTTSRNKCTFRLQNSAPNGVLVYDNFYYGYDNKEYVEAKEPTPEGVPTISGTHNGGEYFNSSTSSGIKYAYDADTPKPIPASSGSMSKTYVTEDGYVWFYNTNTSLNNEYIIYANPAVPAADNLMYVLETDLAVGNLPANSLYASYLVVRGNGLSASIYFGADADGNVKFPHAVGDNKNFTFEQNKWHNIRFELYYLSDMAYAGSIFVKVYVDGNFACDIQAVDVKTNTSQNSLFYLQNVSANAWIDYDNLYIGYADNAYVPDSGVTIPEEPERLPDLDTRVEVPDGITGDHLGGAVYNSEATGKRFGFDDNADLPLTSSNTANLISYITTDKFDLISQRTASQTQVKISFNSPSNEEKETRKGNVFEADVVFGGVEEVTKSVLVGRFILYTQDGGKTSLYLRYDPTTGKINLPGEGSVLAGEKFAITPGEWINLRFEYWYYDGSTYVKIYVNDNFVAETKGADAASANENRVDFYTHNNISTAWMGIDNIYTGYTATEYVASKTPDDGDNNQGTDSGNSGGTNDQIDTRVEAPATTGTHTGGAVYTSQATGKRLDFNEVTSAALTSSNSTNAPCNVTKEGYLLFEQKAVSQYSISIPYPTLSTDESATRKGNVLEADVVIGGTDAMDKSGLVGRFILSSQDGRKTSVYFYYNTETKLIELPKWGNLSDGEAVTLNPGEWYNLRFEYWYVDGEIRSKLYVNGEYKATFEGADNANSTTNAAYFYFHNVTSGIWVGLDNIYTGYTTTEYAVPNT